MVLIWSCLFWMQVPKLDLDPNSRSSSPNDYFGYPLNPLIHFLISSLRIRAAWLQSFSQIFHKWKQMYIDYFPLWFTHFALVLKNSSCFQNNNDNKTNRLQSSGVVWTEAPGSLVLIPNSTTYSHGTLIKLLSLSVPQFPFENGKNNSTYLRVVLRIKTALYTCTMMQKAL